MASVFNCRFTGTVDALLQCSICFNTMLKPVSLNCGHSGCMECLTELTAQNAMPKCPMCRKDFRAATMSVNIALDHVISELPVECLSDGCGWKGKYGSAPDHYSSCPKLRIECENAGCLHEAVREEMLDHAASCNKRKVPCPDCTQSVTWELLNEHQQGKCSNAVVPCPLDCGKTFHRSDLNLHLHKCENKACECEVTGCRRIVMRQCMTQHLQEAALSHYRLQSGEIQRLRQQIHEKDNNIATNIKVTKVASFTWTLENFPNLLARQHESNEPITSPLFLFHEDRWRGVITPQMEMYLQLVSSVNTVTAEIRVVMMSESKEQSQILYLGHATLKEGEMWGRSMTNINKWMDKEGKLKIKFLISYLSFNTI